VGTDGVRLGQAYPTGPFAYASQQAYGILSNWWNKVLARQMSVQEAMSQGARQVNAFLTEQRYLVKSAGSFEATYARLKQVPLGENYPAPSVGGLGLPPSPGRDLVQYRSGAWTLVGSGWDVWNYSDNCAFAGIAFTGSEGEFTCRVVALENVSCPYISPWAKFGLMARGDLSDDAADVTIEGTGANGTGIQLRFAPNLYPTASGFGAASAGGVLGANDITLPNTKPAANYIKRPFWLRMQRKGLTWYFYTSWDGSHWNSLGNYTADMGGCWVGLFVSSGNFAFNGKGAIRVTFDNVSFTPNVFFQIGTAQTSTT
jgi:hypothetical protein